MEKFLTKKEVCEKLNINTRTFEKYCLNEDLPVHTITSHKKYVYMEELLDWLKHKQRLYESKKGTKKPGT